MGSARCHLRPAAHAFATSYSRSGYSSSLRGLSSSAAQLAHGQDVLTMCGHGLIAKGRNGDQGEFVLRRQVLHAAVKPEAVQVGVFGQAGLLATGVGIAHQTRQNDRDGIALAPVPGEPIAADVDQEVFNLLDVVEGGGQCGGCVSSRRHLKAMLPPLVATLAAALAATFPTLSSLSVHSPCPQ